MLSEIPAGIALASSLILYNIYQVRSCFHEHYKVLSYIDPSHHLEAGFSNFAPSVTCTPDILVCQNASHNSIAQESRDSWAHDIWAARY